MKIKKIVPCVCIKYKPSSSVSTHYGMPILRVVAEEYKGKAYELYEAVCPRCGDGTLDQYKSAYCALKAWNESMKRKWEMKDPITGEKYHDYEGLPSLMDGDGWPWSEPQASIDKELREWDI